MTKYFMFSSEQMKVRKEADKKIGKTYKPGQVLVNGHYRQYTEIVSDPANATYPDAILVASGDKKYRR